MSKAYYIYAKCFMKDKNTEDLSPLWMLCIVHESLVESLKIKLHLLPAERT
jgi:hypothetical protein